MNKDDRNLLKEILNRDKIEVKKKWKKTEEILKEKKRLFRGLSEAISKHRNKMKCVQKSVELAKIAYKDAVAKLDSLKNKHGTLEDVMARRDEELAKASTSKTDYLSSCTIAELVIDIGNEGHIRDVLQHKRFQLSKFYDKMNSLVNKI